ncbi:hypothetical protein TBLA_0A07210 [Henningerozyma blattae CBS 6284]|uniref:Uncharacterized protein n=1 Tax=Henningerozyma blattae (strain ATCC 34711 / CBS 6284 / DSM 70876 / NBRC 10599 / NRRL Y-10934 / UCD 77-7) TaxID=1071380 RepID=I2GWK9_HENB6|nr:hypothetical protein TBLA_0A07210 [Tetrapisispora blattae CBS 6284]CCH58511.1 hypothetical protein TBLA_0A07210 [Tetrapisispora blattae CBS 6284]
MQVVNRDVFYRLASDLEEERLQSVVLLVKELDELKANNSDENRELVVKEWNYVVNRLINGLASNRKGARLGFSLCLTEVLNLALSQKWKNILPPNLTDISSFLHLISDTLSIPSSKQGEPRKLLKGKDERGLLFGKLFALQSLLNDPIFGKIFNKDNKAILFEFIYELIALSNLKNWIKEPTLFTLFNFIQKIIEFLDRSDIVQLLNILASNNLTLTNEGLSIYIYLIYTNPHISPEDIQIDNNNNNTWKNNDPFLKSNIVLLSKVLLNTSAASQSEKHTSNANWTPRLHYVWDVILPILLNPKSSDKLLNKNGNKRRKVSRDRIKFNEFWRQVIDESFFNEKASHERKYLGFLIIQKTFPLLNTANDIESIFTSNLIRSIINQMNDSKRYLNKISHKTIDQIVSQCQSNSELRLIPVLNGFLFKEENSSSINFDKLTKTKTISRLINLQDLSTDTLSKLFFLFTSKLDSFTTTTELQFLLDSILHIIRSHKSQIIVSHKFLDPVLEPIILLTFFKETADVSISNILKDRLISILNDLTTVGENSSSIQYLTLNLIVNLNEDPKNVLNFKFDDSLLEVKDSAITTLKRAIEHSKRDSRLKSLVSLLSLSVIQLYLADIDSIATIQDLCDFYDRYKSNTIMKNDKNRPSLGIIEILLALFAQKKSILKKLGLAMWESFIDLIELNEFDEIFDVLLTRENKEGFARLFEGDDEYEEIDSHDDEEKDEDKNIDDISTENSDDDNSSDEENDSIVESNDDINRIDKEATSALAKALKLPDNIINDKGEVDLGKLEDISDNEVHFSSSDDDADMSDESMDDEQMMELDGQLSQIFSRRKEALSNIQTGNKRKLDVKESRENVIAFKHRIVDMIEVYLKHIEIITKSSENIERTYFNKILNSIPLIIKSLLLCIQQTLDRNLAEKISKLLKNKLFKIKLVEFKDCGDLTSENILEWISTLHTECILVKKSGQYQPLYFKLCSGSSLFYCRIFAETSTNADLYDSLIDLYGQTTKTWFKNSEMKIPTTIFSDFHNWLSSKRSVTTSSK